MAKKNVQQNYTDEEKLRRYAERVANPSLTPQQRSWASMRVKQLTAKLSGSSAKKNVPQQPTAELTEAQRCARSAGIGYGAAKSGKRVPVEEENKQAFRDGVKRGRALKP